MPLEIVPKIIVSSRPHEPPRKSSAFAIVWAVPPAAGIFLSFPSAKNPIQRLSGDQNGRSAFSAPSIIWAVPPCKDLSHKAALAPGAVATKTIDLPSGDKANWGTAAD